MRRIARLLTLAAVPASSLPSEARETRALIARGAPYPYTPDHYESFLFIVEGK